MKDKSITPAGSGSPGRHETPRRPGQPGEQDQRRPGSNPDSEHPTGPHAPYERCESDGAAAIKHDAAGQYAKPNAKPNPGGLVSANPVVLSKDGEASREGGHGRERDADSER